MRKQIISLHQWQSFKKQRKDHFLRSLSDNFLFIPSCLQTSLIVGSSHHHPDLAKPFVACDSIECSRQKPAVPRRRHKVKKRERACVSVTVNYCDWHATDWRISELLRRWWAPPPPELQKPCVNTGGGRSAVLFNSAPQFVPPLPPVLRFVQGSCTKPCVCLLRSFSRHLLYCADSNRAGNVAPTQMSHLQNIMLFSQVKSSNSKTPGKLYHRAILTPTNRPLTIKTRDSAENKHKSIMKAAERETQNN